MTPVPELYAAPLRRLGLTGRLGRADDAPRPRKHRGHDGPCRPQSAGCPESALAGGGARCPLAYQALAGGAFRRRGRRNWRAKSGRPSSSWAARTKHNWLAPWVITLTCRSVNGAGTLSLMHSAALFEPLPPAHQQRFRPPCTWPLPCRFPLWPSSDPPCRSSVSIRFRPAPRSSASPYPAARAAPRARGVARGVITLACRTSPVPVCWPRPGPCGRAAGA